MKKILFILMAFVTLVAGNSLAQERKKKFEIRYAVIGAGTKRNATLENAVGRGSGMMSGEAGYTVRALSGNYGTRRWRFFRVGVRSSVPLGSSGFHASARAALFVHVEGSGVPGTGSGKEAETRLTYIVPKTPLFLAVGYRVEGFTVNAARNARPEEMSGLLLGGGIRLAR